MPDDTFQIPDVPAAEEDLLAPTEERFYECAGCALIPGSPTLCGDCLERRTEHSQTGRTRRPIYRSLRNDDDRRRYVMHLRWARDQNEDESPVTEEELDREFPDRHEERLEGNRWGARGAARRERMYTSLGVLGPSMWNRDLVVSRITPQGVEREPAPDLFNLQPDAEFLDQRLFRALGISRELAFAAGQRSGSSYAMALAAIQTLGLQESDTELLREALRAGRSVAIDTETQVPGQPSVQPIYTIGQETPVDYVVGVDPAQGSSRSMAMVANFGMLYGSTPNPNARIDIPRPVFERLDATETECRAVAVLLADRYAIDIEDVIYEFLEAWTLRSIQQLLHTLGIPLSDVGMAPLPVEQAQTPEYVEEFIRHLRPLQNAPGLATGPVRFERVLDVEDGPTRLPEPPPPRTARPEIDPNVLRYINHPRHGSKTKDAFEKLFGKEGEKDFAFPSRFEKINWSED